MQIQTLKKVCQIFSGSRECPLYNAALETDIECGDRSEPSRGSWSLPWPRVASVQTQTPEISKIMLIFARLFCFDKCCDASCLLDILHFLIKCDFVIICKSIVIKTVSILDLHQNTSLVYSQNIC